MRVHILSSGMGHQNARGFLFPILLNRRALRASGTTLRVYREAHDPSLAECDALLVDSKAVEPGERARLLASWATRCRVGYFDLSDSTCVDADLVAKATLYFKSQLPTDRTHLTRPLYGRRVFTDYYHRTAGIADDGDEWSTPVPSSLLGRIVLGWNAGLANYSLHGPRMAGLYERVPVPVLLRSPRSFRPPAAQRPVGLALRMNLKYGRRTVEYQRERTAQLLASHAPTRRVSKRGYFRELAHSRISVSPYGWGEINQRDFEAYLAGVLVVKPDMSHLDTWPQWFEPNRTYVPFAWDFSDLQETVASCLAEANRCVEIATAAQARYRHYVASEAGHEEFRQRFQDCLSRLTAR